MSPREGQNYRAFKAVATSKHSRVTPRVALRRTAPPTEAAESLTLPTSSARSALKTRRDV